MLDLYERLEKVFVESTTHQWKNNWEHEGDREDRTLYIKRKVPFNNLFLLTNDVLLDNFQPVREVRLEGPQNFKVMVTQDGTRLRIDIEANDLDIFYFVDNEPDWLATCDFIVELCQKTYDANLIIHKTISEIPKEIWGLTNPDFTRPYRRERCLNDLGVI